MCVTGVTHELRMESAEDHHINKVEPDAPERTPWTQDPQHVVALRPPLRCIPQLVV